MAGARQDPLGMPAPVASPMAQARNVVLVGPAGSGKTTLMESLLTAAGAIARRGSVDEGTAVGDRDPAAIRQHRSVELAVATFGWGDVTITLVDTPGHVDFTGGLRAGLRAADSALFVVSSTDGVDAATIRLWEECEVLGVPRLVVVTNLDRERADFDETVAVCQRVLSGTVLPLVLPIHGDEGGVAGFVDLLDEQIWEWTQGEPRLLPAEPRHQELIESERAALIEAVVTESEDETLLDSFLDGDHVDVALLTTDLERAVARGHLHPVVGHAVTSTGVGSELLLDLIARALPSPLERPLPVVTHIDGSPAAPLECDASGPLVAEVVRTTSDPHTGRTCVVRVHSGTLRADAALHVSGHFPPRAGHADHDVDERAGHLMTLLGAQHREVPAAPAGAIVAVGRLAHAQTGDTLSDPGLPLVMEPWLMPEPLLPVALRALGAADEDRLATAVARIAAEDPTLRVEHAAGSGRLVAWTLGEAHADLLLERIRGRYGVEVEVTDLQPSIRATFRSPATGTGRLVRQTGGHGQYAIVDLEVEPLPEGAGLEFADRIVGGAVPHSYIDAVRKGVRMQMERGAHGGFPLVDLRVTLVDGRAHSVDSSDAAFEAAGAMALKDAAERADLALLEPLVTVTVDVPDEHVGAVIADLTSRRGNVRATHADGIGRTTVVAVVPEAQVSRYAIDIRSVTHGTGAFTREPAGYGPVPPSIAAGLLRGT